MSSGPGSCDEGPRETRGRGTGKPSPSLTFIACPPLGKVRRGPPRASGALSLEDFREGRIGEVVGLCHGPVGDRSFRDVHP